MNEELIENLSRLHTTKMGISRIQRNLSLTTQDVILWCQKKIRDSNTVMKRQGKNWYCDCGDCVITVNASSYTIITAHPKK